MTELKNSTEKFTTSYNIDNIPTIFNMSEILLKSEQNINAVSEGVNLIENESKTKTEESKLNN